MSIWTFVYCLPTCLLCVKWIIKAHHTHIEDALASVQRAVWEGCAKWYNVYIGLELGLTPGTLHGYHWSCRSASIFQSPDHCFTATLKEWGRTPQFQLDPWAHHLWTPTEQLLKRNPSTWTSSNLLLSFSQCFSIILLCLRPTLIYVLPWLWSLLLMTY